MISKLIKKEVMAINNDYKKQSNDHYDFWQNHIKYVVKESLILAKELGADEEIVEISAMLHDIAMMCNVGTKKEHHINGAIIARKMLEKYNVDENMIQRIENCILHHRTSNDAQNIEELCVADGDILAHFDNIPMCFYSCFNLKGLMLNDIDKIEEMFKKDFDDLSSKTKKVFEARYKKIMDVLFAK